MSPKSVATHASGMTALIVGRIAEHQQEFGGRLPERILLHQHTSAALNDETYRRYGVAHGFDLGVPLALCGCNEPFAPDWMKRADGRWEIL